jgi:O-antigen biosynthesis protein WbqP
LDLALAILTGIILAPIAVLIGAIILWDDGRPALFIQQRVGRHGKTFDCYKFRTMKRDTGDHASHHVAVSRITRFGSVARRFKLDEIPQIYNVLRGEMSFVGPRPCLPKQTELVELRRASGVAEMMPGITGLAQIKGIDMSNPEILVSCETEYLRTRSLALDIRILFATVFGQGLRSDAAQTKRGES